MSPALTELRAAARLDLAEVLRSRALVFTVGAELLLAAVFVLVGLRESAVLGFTGIGRVLLSFSHALLFLLPLLALAATAQVVNRARDDGTLEFLFSHPFHPALHFTAVSLTRFLALALPLGILFAALGLFGRLAYGEELPWAFIGRALAVSAALLAAFVGIGLLISTTVRNQARALVYVLVTWALAVALLDFGLIALLLRFPLEPRVVFALAALNPVGAARLALLSGPDPELAILGPVGFYLSTRVGPGPLLALGIAWPALVGLCTWGAALRSFVRRDLV